MKQQFNTLNLKPIFVNAINGKEVIFNIDSSLYDEKEALLKNKKKLSAGELGCALSHLKIYKKIIAEKIPIALICEDDIQISNKILKLLEKILNQKNTWDWLQVDYMYGYEFLKDRIHHTIKIFKYSKLSGFISLIKLIILIPILVIEELLLRLCSFGNIIIIFKIFRPLYRASCYFVTYQGAQKLVNINDPIIYPADRVPNQARLKNNFKMKIVIPQLSQHPYIFESDIAL